MEELPEGKQQYETAKSQERANNKMLSSVVLDMLIQLSNDSENLDEATKAELSSIIGRLSILSTQLDEATELHNDTENIGTENRPEGYLSLDELSESLEVSKSLIKYAIKLSEDYGEETNNSQLSTESIELLSPDQQKLVETVIKSEIWIPEGYMTANGIAKLLEVTPAMAYAAAKRLKNKGLIEPIYRNIQNHKAPFYSPKDQIQIEKEIETFTEIPDGYIRKSELIRKLKTDMNTLNRIIDQIPPDLLGPVKIYKNNINDIRSGRPTSFYSPDQQKIITAYFTY
jgi:predicted transcriptional regulator